MHRREAVGRARVRREQHTGLQLAGGERHRPVVVGLVPVPGRRRRVDALPAADVRADALGDRNPQVGEGLRDGAARMLTDAAKHVGRGEIDACRERQSLGRGRRLLRGSRGCRHSRRGRRRGRPRGRLCAGRRCQKDSDAYAAHDSGYRSHAPSLLRSRGPTPARARARIRARRGPQALVVRGTPTRGRCGTPARCAPQALSTARFPSRRASWTPAAERAVRLQRARAFARFPAQDRRFGGNRKGQIRSGGDGQLCLRIGACEHFCRTR